MSILNIKGSYVAYHILRNDEYIDGGMRTNLGYVLTSAAAAGTIAMLFLRPMPWIPFTAATSWRDGFKSTIK